MDIGRFTWSTPPVLGLVAGVAIACVDNIAAGGEVSPIVIVAILFAATLAAGFLWGWRGTVASAATWVCVPLAHTAKHALNLPDSLHPNTWVSILYLAVFTFAIAAAGTGLGVALNRSLKASAR